MKKYTAQELEAIKAETARMKQELAVLDEQIAAYRKANRKLKKIIRTA